MNLLESLNQNQRDAVLHTEGPLLILAGAGSGKTRVITHRIAHIIKEKYIRPWEIFSVTFTNKAAQEMKERITNLIGSEGERVFIKTFHSASVYILRMYGERINIPKSFTIYDGADQAAVIKEILKDLRVDPKKYKPAYIASEISSIKDNSKFIQGVDLSLLTPENFPFDFTDFFHTYQNKLQSNNALDFNDLLLKTLELLTNHEDILRILQAKWKYFMVDEYQDTNHAQYLITKYLAASSKNLCVVGDDDQSIYSWRGADIRNILDFEKDYPDTKTITLQENYRSTKQILSAASAIIQNNDKRKDKDLLAIKGDGEPITWCQTNNEWGEAEYVINKIITLKSQQNLTNQDFSIFYRTNAQSRIFEEQLRREKIPYKVIGGLKFYDRKEIKDIVSYLKFIVNPSDSISMMRIINRPARGIGEVTVTKINTLAKSENASEWNVIKNDLLTGKIPKGLTKFKDIMIESIATLADIPEKISLSKFIKSVIDLSGYRENLVEQNNIESNARIENIDEFINSIIDFEISDPEATLEQFLQDISLLTSEENPEENPEDINNVVTLMTVHNAKGLEFPVVFLTGLQENTFPHRFSIDTDEGIEEERRLCYVGITRAKEQIFLTNYELRRNYYGDTEYQTPSRFIYEIPEDLLVVKTFSSHGISSRKPKTNFGSRPKPVAKKSFPSFSDTKTNVKSTIDLTSSSGSGSNYSVSERVLHPKYGIGTIKKIEGKGDNVKLTILFNTNKKVFLEKYTPLEKFS